MEAIILAGGLGTRLKSVVRDIPKPMASIGNKPFLEYLINYLIDYGISRIILAVGYKYQVITSFFGNQYRSCEIVYSIENEPLGTGGAIKLACMKAKSETIWIYNGDTFLQLPLDQMFDFHKEFKSRFSMALKPMENFSRYGNVILENQRVISFDEKKYHSKGIINAGIYLAEKSLIDEISFSTKSYSFENHLSTILVKHRNVLGFICNQYFIDIGIPEDYERAQIELPLYLCKCNNRNEIFGSKISEMA